MHIIQTDSVSLERVILKKCHSKNCLAKWFHGNLPNIGEGVRATNAPVHYRVLLLFLIFVFNLHMYSITSVFCFFVFFVVFFGGGGQIFTQKIGSFLISGCPAALVEERQQDTRAEGWNL